MHNCNMNNVLNYTIAFLGREGQEKKFFEEMEELSRELGQKDVSESKVIDELADVYITLTQMMLMYGQNKVWEKIFYKMNRLEGMIDLSRRIEQEYYPNYEHCTTLSQFREMLWQKKDGSESPLKFIYEIQNMSHAGKPALFLESDVINSMMEGRYA